MTSARRSAAAATLSGPPLNAWEELADVLLVRAARPGPADEGSDLATPSDDDLASSRALFRASLAEPAPFSLLVDAAGLDVGSAEVLALLCAVELDRAREVLVSVIHGDSSRRRLSLGALRWILGADHAGPLAVAPDSRLRRAEFVEVSGSGPWSQRTVVVHPTVVWALLGDGSRDPEVPGEASVSTCPDVHHDGAMVVAVSGEDRARRLQTALRATAAESFLVTPAPAGAGGWAAVVREATLRGFGVVVEVDDEIPPEGRVAIERADHLAWALSSPHDLPIDDLPRRAWVARAADNDPPSDVEWAEALGRKAPRRHPLTAEQLRLVSIACPAVGGNVDAAVRRLAAGRIDRLARRVRPERVWDDLVLPADQLDQLRHLAARYRNRARVYGEWCFRPAPSAGVAALFAGESGTGKTMAAEILAGDLGLELYKLDVAAVVSKYIGETEKNLDEIFAAAAAGNVVLFFDEADALFGKRTDIGDAHDRYANVEVAYLLQRLESYEGVVILATNLQKNIDGAFLRRLHAVVDFPLPDEPERRRIWERNLPAAAPVGDVDIDLLSRRFELSGGGIRNAALTAAFLAAEAGTVLTMETVLAAVRREFQKMGRLVDPSEFSAPG